MSRTKIRFMLRTIAVVIGMISLPLLLITIVLGLARMGGLRPGGLAWAFAIVVAFAWLSILVLFFFSLWGPIRFTKWLAGRREHSAAQHPSSSSSPSTP